MAVKINNVDVITDARQLKIRSCDADAQALLRDALRQDDDKLIIYDSSGTAIHTFYGARE